MWGTLRLVGKLIFGGGNYRVVCGFGARWSRGQVNFVVAVFVRKKMKQGIRDIIAEVSANGVAGEVGELIRRLCACDSAGGLAEIVTGTTIPILLPAVALVGTQARRGLGGYNESYGS